METDDSTKAESLPYSTATRFNPIVVESMYDSARGLVKTVIHEQPQSNISQETEFGQGGTKFNDGVRSVDFVLVWDDSYVSSTERTAVEKRNIFEHNLEEEGLELEHEPAEQGSGLHFCKVHAPDEVLRRYSEILKLRMPMREVEKIPHKYSRGIEAMKSGWEKLKEKFVYVDKKVFPDKSQHFTAIYSRDKEYLYSVQEVE